MKTTLSKRTAQKIVDTIKDVCGCNINFIHPDGTIFASTDKKRIGMYHAVAKECATTHQTIEIPSDNPELGTLKGINIPFYHQQELIAIIGLTGTPDEVRPFALLAQKVTSLILKEQEIGSVNERKKNQLNYIICSLIEGEEGLNLEYIENYVRPYHLTPTTQCRVILIAPEFHSTDSNVSLLEQRIYQFFERLKLKFYTFNYPNEYILIIPERQYATLRPIIEQFATNAKDILTIGIGHPAPLIQQQQSYTSAKIALNSRTKDQALIVFEDLDIELLLGNLTDDMKQEYLDKTIGMLSEEELHLLEVYFEKDMSLKETAEALFLHKNTVQYQLNRIREITGYNPRRFQDAARLWVGVRVRRWEGKN